MSKHQLPTQQKMDSRPLSRQNNDNNFFFSQQGLVALYFPSENPRTSGTSREVGQNNCKAYSLKITVFSLETISQADRVPGSIRDRGANNSKKKIVWPTTNINALKGLTFNSPLPLASLHIWLGAFLPWRESKHILGIWKPCACCKVFLSWQQSKQRSDQYQSLFCRRKYTCVLRAPNAQQKKGKNVKYRIILIC